MAHIWCVRHSCASSGPLRKWTSCPCVLGPSLCPAKASPQPTASHRWVLHAGVISPLGLPKSRAQWQGVQSTPLKGLSAWDGYRCPLPPTTLYPRKGSHFSKEMLSQPPTSHADLFIPLILVSSLTCFTLKYLH